MPDLGKIRPAFVLKDQRLADLKTLVPEAVADGAIDWTGLKQALGEALEDDTQEPFGLSWPGKREAKKMAFTPPKGTLRPLTGQGIEVDTTENLIIEGDNLEVLKLLQKAYFGRVKMIYIDPPYNTGNDFVYSDNFTDTIEDYLRKTGALDADGKPLSTNPRTSGRFHSNWLSMIYPRLVVAKTLLRDDGVIFVSIDDNEVHHLRQVMDEVFGEENFVGVFVWEGGRKNDSRLISTMHDYILTYTRNQSLLRENDTRWRVKKDGLEQIYARVKALRAEFGSDFQTIHSKLLEWFRELPEGHPSSSSEHFNYVDQRGIYFPDNLRSPNPRPNLVYDWKGYQPHPNGWAYGRDKMELFDKEDRLVYPESLDQRIKLKSYLHEHEYWAPGSVFYKDRRAATRSLASLLEAEVFDFPKDTSVIARLASVVSSNDEIVLDFFAGSGTTAQAVLELNQQDGGHRKFILVQIPEKTGRTDYPTIADITKERVRRVITKLKALPPAAEEVAEATPGYLPKPPMGPPTSDLGFRVMSLGPSNLKAWDLSQTQNLDDLERQLSIFADNPLAEGWKPGDLLVEVMLWEGFSPTSRAEVKTAGTDTFYRVTDPHMAYNLWCNFGASHDFTLADLKALGAGVDDLFVFLDSSLQNNLKSRLVDLVKIKVV